MQQQNTFGFFREIIASNIQEFHKFEGEIELNEFYFGERRKDQYGRGAAGKVPAFGLLKRKGKVYTTIINDAKSSTLMPIIKKKSLI